MAIYDIFSKRQKKLRGEVPDTYVYDDLPKRLRVQIVQIWKETLGVYHITHTAWGREIDNPQVEDSYRIIVNALRREYGVFQLTKPKNDFEEKTYSEELALFFLHVSNIEYALDAIELSFRVIDHGTRKWEYLHRDDASRRADAAIEELNYRFKEHAVGYQFTSGQIIRIDSELVHADIVVPALKLLHEQHYAGAQDEFLKAHKYYRQGDPKGALSECLKAFESVMKAICDKRRWPYSPTATAKHLIQICFDKGLIEPCWQSKFSALRSLLESSVPTGRNKMSGHGQGTNPVSVPNHLVAYMLHMTASAIVFLAEAEKQLP